jgi:ABC-type Fe3+/spermidine/putrescine transport system ATPase subunit
MNQPTHPQQNYVATAHQLRRDYLATLLDTALNSLSQSLRTEHERALRRASRVLPTLRSTIGTPA